MISPVQSNLNGMGSYYQKKVLNLHNGVFTFRSLLIFSPTGDRLVVFQTGPKCILRIRNKWEFMWSLFSFCRQERFIRRWVEALSDPRVTHEIRSIWINYWSQVSPVIFSLYYCFKAYLFQIFLSIFYLNFCPLSSASNGFSV